MSDLELKIKKTAAAEHRWQEEDLDVEAFNGIDLAPCRFYTVTHRTLPVAEASTYGLLPGGAVVSQNDETAVEKILAAGGGEAPPASWAELLARFHWGVGPGRVQYTPGAPLHDGEAPDERVTAPRMEDDNQVRFFLLNPETELRYEVSASVEDGRVQDVEKTVVR